MSEPQAIGVSGRYRARVREGGRIVADYGWKKNLILDQGLDKFATVRFADCFLFAAAGTDNTPVQDSPAALATWSATTLTASAATWASTDVGKMVVFATGQQAYITGFTDSTHVTVDRANTIPVGTAFVMYRVNQTGLVAEIARTNLYSQNDGDNSTTTSGPLVQLQRTFIFPVESGTGNTYYEIGFSDLAAAGANLFSRVVLNPGITVLGPSNSNAGQQLEVTYQLRLTFGPTSPNVLPPTQQVAGLPRSYQIYQIQPTVPGFDITVNAFVPFNQSDRIVISGTGTPYDNVAGAFYTIAAIVAGPASSIISVNGTSHGSVTGTTSADKVTGFINLSQIAQDYAIAIIGPSGITTINPAQVLSGEPSQIGSVWAADIPFNAAVSTGTSTPATNFVSQPYTIGAYTGKSFQITKSATFPSATAFNFIAFGLGMPDIFANQVLRVDCGQRQSKLGGESLTLNFTQSWVRSFF